MKISCIYLPRIVLSLGAAMYMTEFECLLNKYFEHFLDDIAESMDKPFSLEFYAVERSIYACFAAEEEMHRSLTAGIYSFYEESEIREVEDYTRQVTDNTLAVSGELGFSKPDIYPIKNFYMFAYNSLSPIVSALNSLPTEDRMVVQVLVKPMSKTIGNQLDLWLERYLDSVAKKFRLKTYLKKQLGTNSAALIRDKCNRRLFWVNYRITAMTEGGQGRREDHEKRLLGHVKQAADALKVLNTIDENKLTLRSTISGRSAIERMQARKQISPLRFSSIEVATLWHPPQVGLIRNSALVVSRKSPPPRNLPSKKGDPQISFFAVTNHRDRFIPFGIKRFDRRLHSYIVGKSGSGKSCLLQLLIKNDIDSGHGMALLDPHGDLVDRVVKLIPEHRLKDVVIFDPADGNFPPAFNPMSAIRPDLKVRVTLSLIDAFKRVFGVDWSDRMDHVLRYATMAMLAVPGASVATLRRFLADSEYRNAILERTGDEAIRRFWQQEYPSRQAEFDGGVISPILNRFDQLLSSPLINNILGQPKNLFDFRSFMDSRKIVLMKISKGTLGVENATLLGSLLISKIYEAAMSRADIPQEQRQDFYFYIDEFQNFANESFGEILSESRKYRLNLTMANQFLGQLSSEVRQTIFGNVGNLLAFRVGSEDAGALAKEFSPRAGVEDILNLGFRDFYLKMSIDGQVLDAFSGRTIDVPVPADDGASAERVREISRQQYCQRASELQAV